MCRSAHPKTTQTLRTARQTIQPAEPYAAKPKPNILPRAKGTFWAEGGSSGPKGPVIDLPIFGEFSGPSHEGLGAGPPTLVHLQVVKGLGGPSPCTSRVVKGWGALTLVHLQVVKGWGAFNLCQPLSIWRPPQVVKGWEPPTLVHLEAASSREGLGGPQPSSIWKPPQVVKGWGPPNLCPVGGCLKS